MSVSGDRIRLSARKGNCHVDGCFSTYIYMEMRAAENKRRRSARVSRPNIYSVRVGKPSIFEDIRFKGSSGPRYTFFFLLLLLCRTKISSLYTVHGLDKYFIGMGGAMYGIYAVHYRHSECIL